jgi:hypothetical protein
MEKETKTELEISNQLEITPDNRDKEIKSEDLNMLINAASSMYTGLAISIVDSLERLEIISPVVNKETLMSLEKKANGLSVNLLKLEEATLEVKTDNEAIEKLLKEKDTLEEIDQRDIDLKLIPRFESLIYKVGGLTKELEALSEYYLTNLKAPIDSLELNAKKKHEELSEIAASEESKKEEESNNEQQ